MSRLPPFQKFAPFEFPRAPLSPPETTTDAIEPTQISASAFPLTDHELRSSEIEPSPAHSAPIPERLELPGSRFRRTSSITYHTSGLRESRERTSQRGLKAFVIIIPPPSFSEHGQLGHTLSSGPRHRLSQGMLMPLFPTMYGQLAAIAREYNFPSTVGLCLYPHFTEHGVTMTPRISDESWPLFWSHVLESSSVPRSPISGKIEFDIDLRQARWYASWTTSSHRDYADQTLSTNFSTPPSISHERAGSRMSLVDDDQESHVIAPSARHVPRKLSLVDRYDVVSNRSGSLPASRPTVSPERAQAITHILSPIFQEEEPKSARNGLDDRVKEWRASTILKPTPLAVTGQVSLEPANMPNVVPIDDSFLISSNEGLKLEDYTWSPSSLGPSDHGSMLPMSPFRLPSVHIANRAEGSVCLTPSDCTSFGPSDYTLPSTQPSIYRLPSPDIAYRMYEDIPLTPSTATSWGPPVEYPPSPLSVFRAPSIDLGERSVFSRPATPTTATSWGPASRPSSPVSSDFRPRSIHLGDRGDYSRPVSPPALTSSGTHFRIGAPDVCYRRFENSRRAPVGECTPWSYSWPYFRPNHSCSSNTTRHCHSPTAQLRKPWGHLWPYVRAVGQDHSDVLPSSHTSPHNTFVKGERCSASVLTPSVYPRFVIYQPVYPHFDLYPTVPLSSSALEGNPPLSPLDASLQAYSLDIRIKPSYPIFDLYPATYPRNVYELYPPVVMMNILTAPVCYPHFDLYPAIYSKGTQRPQVSRASPSYEVPGVLLGVETPCYPLFNIYPPVFTALPKTTCDTSPIDVKPQAKYPYLTLYSGVYPYFDLYPALQHPDDYQTTFSELHLGNAHHTSQNASYPLFDIYPADGMPTVFGSDASRSGYPHFELYPFVSKRASGLQEARVIHGPCLYPNFDLYPAVYPFLEIYPPLPRDFHATRTTKGRFQHDELPLVRSPAAGPYFDDANYIGPSSLNRRPAEYPCFDLYPSGQGKNGYHRTQAIDMASVKIKAQYPAFNLYPAVYPHFDLWPSLDYPRMAPMPKSARGRKKSAHSRLTHSELHAMVMMERMESSGSFRSIKRQDYPSIIQTTFRDDSTMDLTEEFDPQGFKLYEPVKSFSEELLARRRAPNFKYGIQTETNRSHGLPQLSGSLSGSTLEDKSSSLRVLSSGRTVESRQRTVLSRPAFSMDLASQGPDRLEFNDKLSRSSSFSTVTKNAPSKRDSIVSQRVRALNAVAQDNVQLATDTLSKFPAPPNTLVNTFRSRNF